MELRYCWLTQWDTLTVLLFKTSSEKKSNYQNLKVVIYQKIIRKKSKPYGLQVGNIVYKIRVDNEYFYFYSEYFGSIPYILKKSPSVLNCLFCSESVCLGWFTGNKQIILIWCFTVKKKYRNCVIRFTALRLYHYIKNVSLPYLIK